MKCSGINQDLGRPNCRRSSPGSGEAELQKTNKCGSLLTAEKSAPDECVHLGDFTTVFLCGFLPLLDSGKMSNILIISLKSSNLKNKHNDGQSSSG